MSFYRLFLGTTIGIFASISIGKHLFHQYHRLDLRDTFLKNTHEINDNSENFFNEYLTKIDNGLRTNIINELAIHKNVERSYINKMLSSGINPGNLSTWSLGKNYRELVSYDHTVIYDFNHQDNDSNSTAQFAFQNNVFKNFTVLLIDNVNNIMNEVNLKTNSENNFKNFSKSIIYLLTQDKIFFARFPDLRISQIYLLHYDADWESYSESNLLPSGSGFLIGYPYVNTNSTPNDDYWNRAWFKSFEGDTTLTITRLQNDKGDIFGISRPYTDIINNKSIYVITSWHSFKLEEETYLLCLDYLVNGNPTFSIQQHFYSFINGNSKIQWVLITLISPVIAFIVIGLSAVYRFLIISDQTPVIYRPQNPRRTHPSVINLSRGVFKAIRTNKLKTGDGTISVQHSSEQVRSVTNTNYTNLVFSWTILNSQIGHEDLTQTRSNQTQEVIKEYNLNLSTDGKLSFLAVEKWLITHQNFLFKNITVGKLTAITDNTNKVLKKISFQPSQWNPKYENYLDNFEFQLFNHLQNSDSDSITFSKDISMSSQEENELKKKDVYEALTKPVNKLIKGRTLLKDLECINTIYNSESIRSITTIISPKIFTHFNPQELFTLLELTTQTDVSLVFIESCDQEFHNIYQKVDSKIQNTLKIQNLKIVAYNSKSPNSFIERNLHFSLLELKNNRNLVIYIYTNELLKNQGLGWISSLEVDLAHYQELFRIWEQNAETLNVKTIARYLDES